jgi:hypothetical protein
VPFRALIPPAVAVAGLLGPPIRRPALVAFDLGVPEHRVVAALLAAFRELPEAEAAVLADRLGLFGQRPRTLGDIADEMGISRERVRLLEHTAVRRLQPARGHPSLS